MLQILNLKEFVLTRLLCHLLNLVNTILVYNIIHRWRMLSEIMIISQNTEVEFSDIKIIITGIENASFPVQNLIYFFLTVFLSPF